MKTLQEYIKDVEEINTNILTSMIDASDGLLVLKNDLTRTDPLSKKFGVLFPFIIDASFTKLLEMRGDILTIQEEVDRLYEDPHEVISALQGWHRKFYSIRHSLDQMRIFFNSTMKYSLGLYEDHLSALDFEKNMCEYDDHINELSRFNESVQNFCSKLLKVMYDVKHARLNNFIQEIHNRRDEYGLHGKD